MAVLGLGHAGGSLARAIAGLQLAERVTGWAHEATERDAALTAEAVTFAAVSWEDAVADADLVVLASTVRSNLEILQRLPDIAGSGATVTDLSPLKAPVLEAVRRSGLAWRWVGSHPMVDPAGKGFWSSRADLFEDARVWTVSEGAAEDAVHSVELLWESVGARPRAIEAVAHDRLVSLAEILPRLTAGALAEILEQAGVDPQELGVAGSVMTGASRSDPRSWIEALDESSPALVGALRSLANALERIADQLEEDGSRRVESMMARAHRWVGPARRSGRR